MKAGKNRSGNLDNEPPGNGISHSYLEDIASFEFGYEFFEVHS